MSLIEKAHLLGEGYVLGNEKYDENKEEIDELNNEIYSNSDDIKEVYERTRNWSLMYYDMFYTRFGTKFDKLYFESAMAQKGKEIVLANLGKVFKKSDGAVVFEGEEFGLHTRVFITKEGNPTYEGKDMALAFEQYKDFPFDKNIHVVANEQTGYFKVVFEALSQIDTKFRDREYHLPMGMVNLVGKKISSRKGDIVTVDGLLDDIKRLVAEFSSNLETTEAVTLGCVKYSVLKTGPKLNVSFDIKTSVSLEGDSGAYLQYTFARTQSVLKKAKERMEKVEKVGNLDLSSEESDLMRYLCRLDEISAIAAKNYSPNIVCNYLYNLAQKYNTFYNKHKIIGSETENFRLSLNMAVGQVIKNGLFVLGIEAPSKM